MRSIQSGDKECTDLPGCVGMVILFSSVQSAADHGLFYK